MNPTTSTLNDQPVTAATTVSVADTVGQARAHDGWIVTLDSAGAPLAAIAPSSLARQPADRPLTALIRELPAAVVADAATPVRALLSSWLIDEIDVGSAVILTAHGTVQGVWTGPSLDRAIALATGGGATFGDTDLPGEITIPQLTKACQFLDGGTPCTSVRRFPERPASTPECDNPDGLIAHRFRW
jgi:hypothetical protein